MNGFDFVYRWAQTMGMPALGGTRKGARCRLVLTAWRTNSALVEFEDGLRACVSLNAIRRVK